ncbi:MAG: hypothetical protein AB7O48_16735 [Cyclobacteriaceae bacterium]
MRWKLVLVLVTLLLFSASTIIPVLSQPPDVMHLKDSIDYEFLYGSEPDSTLLESKSNTNFFQVFEDPRLLQLSAGMNFLNVLRWQVPNVTVSPPFITGNPISPVGLLAIDGIPYNSDISYFANLNAFDFDRVVVLSTLNGAPDFGMFGGNGGIMLQRKSGRDVVGPHFEFNSFLTRGLYTPPNNSALISSDRFHLSNSLSFEQDFGALDTRLSYNNTFMPKREFEAGVGMNSLKLNTGIQILPSLRGTLIFERHKVRDILPVPLQVFSSDGESNFRTMGLVFEYQPVRWVRLSTQMYQDDLEHNDRFEFRSQSIFTNGGVLRNDQKRKLIKASIQTKHSFAKNFDIRSLIAIQEDNTTFDREYFGLSQGEDMIKSVTGGLNSTYKKKLSLDLSYRLDENNFAERKKISVYTGAVSWNFTDLLDKSNFIGFGRLRSNFGYRDGNVAHPLTQVYPELSVASPDKFYSSQTGVDVALLKNKIQASYSYYLVFDESFREETIVDGPYQVTFVDYTRAASIKGHELVLGAYPFGTKDWYTKLTLTRLNLGESISSPDWFGNFYLMRDWSGFQFSTSVSYQKGGEIFRNNIPYSASYISLRDVSISHQPIFLGSGKFGLRELTISITGRNLWRIRASGLDNLELYSVNNGMYTSFTLNISGKLY